jgi:hypothetical protein
MESCVLHGRFEIQRHLGKKAARRVLLARYLETNQVNFRFWILDFGLGKINWLNCNG